jgi:hypothetical protein
MRFSNIFLLVSLAIAFVFVFIVDLSIDLYLAGLIVILIAFIGNLAIAYLLKTKQKNKDIHIFYNRIKEPLFARWTVLVLAIIILFFVIWDSTDFAGWFWLTLIATKGIEHLIHNTEWSLIIENNTLHERGFWMKAIPISEITKVHINEQAYLELTTPKGMSEYKLESGISVNVRDKIEEIQTNAHV